ncbi:MAG: hypothetical protein KAS94_03390 [Desulfobulbaceae bacterium]|nr:hypothetical protein [Desulfobulbaceae bacterium]
MVVLQVIQRRLDVPIRTGPSIPFFQEKVAHFVAETLAHFAEESMAQFAPEYAVDGIKNIG